jgi:hypothetical protein
MVRAFQRSRHGGTTAAFNDEVLRKYLDRPYTLNLRFATDIDDPTS